MYKAYIALFFCTLLACPLRAQDATIADFHAFCEAIEGRWVGKVTQIDDLPGFGKKGEVGTSYFTARFLADKYCLLGEFQGAGEGCGTWILAYDPAGKRITSLALFSNGRRSDGVIIKHNGKWEERLTAVDPDGTKQSIVSVLTISDNGNTNTWTENGTTNGKKLEEAVSVWRRVHVN